MSDVQVPITGGCLCKAVRYSVSSQPVGTRQCWCRDCQYLGAGSSTVNLIFAVSDVTVTGDLKLFTSQADSGNTMLRGFCPSCGTPVTSASTARPELVILRAGTLDHTGVATPAMNIWTDSAPAWAHLDPDVPAAAKQPLPAPPLKS
jgi:hypothetical protein